ncbi:phasin family protein [Cupriavidus pinatubonensis]|uniref:phasin family protein n=1 Tax=Cupriavidus pinatubonensis TaxID=248026 RepID=UPI00112A37F9|nr:phasin family protein [Cupriavidus pinatubonensis]TPQ37083.1 phasin [Cupriavidus pinatubonensis]
MTQWTAEQCTKVQLAGLDALVGLTNKAMQSVGKLMELNLQTMNANLARTQEAVAKAMSAQNPQEFAALQIELFQPAADNILEYWRQLQDIHAATRTEFEKVFEVQYTTSKEQMQSLIESAVSNAPSGSTAPLAAWQEAVKATTTLYESMQSTAKQAVEVAENSFHTAAEAASKGVRRRAAQTSSATAK